MVINSRFNFVKMPSTPQYPALSSFYFEVELRETVVPQDLHEVVLRAIGKHFVHWKYRLIIRYHVLVFDYENDEVGGSDYLY